jgi:putative oxidoreductase
MLPKLLDTADDPVLTIARIMLGIIMFAHGSQKMLGWFGGNGFQRTMAFFRQEMKIPSLLAFLAIVTEFFGSLGLIFGLLTRIAALGIAIVVVVAIFMVHSRFGLFQNWYGNQKGEGFEYHLLAIALAVVLLKKGGGALSLDHAIYRALAPPLATQSMSLLGPDRSSRNRHYGCRSYLKGPQDMRDPLFSL